MTEREGLVEKYQALREHVGDGPVSPRAAPALGDRVSVICYRHVMPAYVAYVTEDGRAYARGTELTAKTEAIEWARGWKGKAVDALRAYLALGQH